MKELKILYRDQAVTVCLKPAGIISEEGEGGMIDLLRRQLAESGNSAEFFAVHRLDRDVAGVMVYANTRAAAADLSEQIRNRSFVKQYLAAVETPPEQAEFHWQDLLFFDRTRSKAFVVKRERRGVRQASLHGELLGSTEQASLLLLSLETGRRHQIRAQCAARQLPLIGDRRYGGRAAEQIALWSYRLAFIHPVRHEQVSFCHPPLGDTFDALRQFLPQITTF